MFKSIILPAVFIASSCLPTAMAETCVAVGWMRDNSVVRLGPQGGSQGVQLFNAKGDQIGEMDCSIDCPGACTDLAAVESEELGDTFFWAGSCNINDFKYVPVLLAKTFCLQQTILTANFFAGNATVLSVPKPISRARSLLMARISMGLGFPPLRSARLSLSVRPGNQGFVCDSWRTWVLL